MHEMTARRIVFPLVAVLMFAGSLAARAQEATPTATVTTTAVLNGQQKVVFSQDVTNVTHENLLLRLRGATTSLSIALTCYDAAAARISCRVGPVRKALVRASTPLTPGELYDVVVNPSGAAPIVAGLTAVTTLTKIFRASVVEQETSVAARATWGKVPSRAASAGYFRAERTAGASATFNFTGTSVTWFTRRDRNQGRASVTIDGKSAGIVNNYSATTRFPHPITFAGLSDGPHRIRIRVRGERGSRNSTGTTISIDGFRAGEISSEEATSYGFARLGRSGASGGYVASSNVPTASLSFTFRGRGVDWITTVGPNRGAAAIYVDNKFLKRVDNYAPAYKAGTRRSVTGLSDTVHVLKVVVSANSNDRSRGRWIDWDVWRLRASITDFKRLGAWVDLWDFTEETERSTIQGRLDVMKSRGVRTLYLQTGRYNTSAIHRPSRNAWWLEDAHARGIKVVGWYLPAYSEYLSGDVSKTVRIATYRTPNGHGFDGLAVDIEYRSKTGSTTEFNQGVASHLRRVRAGVGIVFPIGAITFAPLDMDIRPDAWKGFPWGTIGATSDVIMPMGYWSNRTWRCEEGQTRYCPYSYTKENILRSRSYTGLPVHEIGGVGHSVTTGEVDAFASACRDAKAYGGSLYDYGTTKTEFWKPLSRLNLL